MEVQMKERMAQAIAAQNEIPVAAGLQELDAAVQRTADNWMDPIRAGVSYFRIPDQRMPRGRITLLQNGMNAMEMVMHRDYQSLQAQYGGYKSANQIADWQRNDPYLGIIQRGGLHEFDAAQILDQKWHFKPTRDSGTAHRLIWQKIAPQIESGMEQDAAILAVLPQLQGCDLAEYRCDFCPSRSFVTEQHVRNHESVMHKDDVRSRETRDSVSAALSSNGNSEAMAMIARALEMLAQSRLPEAEAEPAKRRPGRPPKPSTDTPPE